MNNDQTLLSSTLLTTGMVSLHVMRVGAPVDVELVIEQHVPMQSRWGWTMSTWEEGQQIKRHHLNLCFPKRGLVEARLAGDRLVQAVLWMLQPGERISMGIQDAADTFWGAFDVAPAAALVSKLPDGAPTELKLTGCSPGAVVKLGAKETMPKSAVLVGMDLLPVVQRTNWME